MTKTAKERIYHEAPDNLIGNFDTSKTLTVTMPMEEFDKLQKLALSAHTDKLSAEKLQEIRVEELKDFNSKILQAELKNQKLQEQLNTAKKALTEAIGDIEQLNGSDDTIKYYKQALAAIGGDDDRG